MRSKEIHGKRVGGLGVVAAACNHEVATQVVAPPLESPD